MCFRNKKIRIWRQSENAICLVQWKIKHENDRRIMAFEMMVNHEKANQGHENIYEYK